MSLAREHVRSHVLAAEESSADETDKREAAPDKTLRSPAERGDGDDPHRYPVDPGHARIRLPGWTAMTFRNSSTATTRRGTTTTSRRSSRCTPTIPCSRT